MAEIDSIKDELKNTKKTVTQLHKLFQSEVRPTVENVGRDRRAGRPVCERFDMTLDEEEEYDSSSENGSDSGEDSYSPEAAASIRVNSPPASTGKASGTGEKRERRKENDHVNIPPLPNAPQFRSWKLAVRDEVSGASGAPDDGFLWIQEVEDPDQTIEGLPTVDAMAHSTPNWHRR